MDNYRSNSRETDLFIKREGMSLIKENIRNFGITKENQSNRVNKPEISLQIQFVMEVGFSIVPNWPKLIRVIRRFPGATNRNRREAY